MDNKLFKVADMTVETMADGIKIIEILEKEGYTVAYHSDDLYNMDFEILEKR